MKREHWIYLAACWSGIFVMSVELLGGRLLAPYFGSSIFVWGGIIAVFMTCLSIGYLQGGKWSLHSPALNRLGGLLLCEALLLLPIIPFGGVFLEYLSYIVPDPRYGSLLGSLFLFGLPTVIGGMVSPYAVRLLISNVQQSGNAAGRLYFASTLGSAIGTLMTSFYLVLYWPLNTILAALISLSVLLGLSLICVHDRQNRRSALTTPMASRSSV